jgi:hypothetical protein
MTEFIFENEEDLNQLPTRLLNIWSTIDGWSFKRRNGIIHFEAREKQSVKTLQQQVKELGDIIQALIAANRLILPEQPID